MADGARGVGAWDSGSLLSLFDPATGVLDRRALSDEGIYQLEMERIFARGWNFMCHESQIPRPGDYFINHIGEDQVIVARDGEGRVNVLLNTCRHRGNALCRAEQGRAKSFVCSYHGWNYGLDGRLIGAPGQKTYYHDDLDRDRLGLARAAQVDSYLGFYFATLARDAPPLHDYLGSPPTQMSRWWTACRRTSSAATGRSPSTICSTGTTYPTATPRRRAPASSTSPKSCTRRTRWSCSANTDTG
jgi:phenylpropionate dioxygenase-like ring-hydroxylating dioxygenase large terminal subunit